MPIVPLGQVVATPGAMQVLAQLGKDPSEFLARHSAADWGDLCDDDKALNDCALSTGARLLSAYNLGNEQTNSDPDKIWIITEAEDDKGTRSHTTILLPEEY